MSRHQPPILAPLTAEARYLQLRCSELSSAGDTLRGLVARIAGENVVMGLGAHFVESLEASVPGLRRPPVYQAGVVAIPAAETDLWLWVRGEGRSAALELAEELVSLCSSSFVVQEHLGAFVYRGGRDLTGYEDGTENPTGLDALAAAFVQGEGPGLDGGSFVAVQLWTHDMETFNGFDPARRDHMIGRRMLDNEEIDDAPESAHVKRTAQEDFEPEAFVLRRSMPWKERAAQGLNFVAFGRSFDAFEAQMHRMSGAEDGIRDALFEFSTPASTAYFWCPPIDEEGRVDLSQLGL